MQTMAKMNEMNENEMNGVNNNYENSLNNRNASNETLVMSYCQAYENKMRKYMRAVSHIPPTPFEMKLRHAEVKNEIVKQYKLVVNNKPHSRQLVSKLENRMEKLFNQLLSDNSNEYHTCQVGFIIGWKCNVNKPTYKVDKIDDRF